MAANYVLPDVVEKRTRFFDGQFLQDQDFVDEQNYHVDRQRRHNRLLHVSGIAEGLTVSVPAANQVAVSPGTAIDSDGRQLALAQAATVDLPAERFNDKQGIELYVAYQESAEDRQTGQGSDDFTRWLERPQMIAVPPGDSYSGSFPPVLLATLALDGAGRVSVDETTRIYSGVRLPGPAADAPALHTAASGLVSLAGSLTIDGSVGIGTTAPSARLSVVQAGITELAGGAQSTVFRATGPALGTASGSEVVLSSTGLGAGSNNNMSLGVRALRTANGSDWYSTALGLGMDVDNVPRAGASLFLHANGNVGIGTPTPGAKLHVTGGAAQLDGNQQLRFTDADTSNNLKVQLWSGFGLGINGGTLFYAANGQHSWRDNGGANERMALTTAANGGLAVMGTGASTFAGNLGIGTTAPAARLHVAGGTAQLDGNQRLVFTDTDTSNNLKVQLWAGYGLGINGGTLFYAANGRHSWRDNAGANERMALSTAANGGLAVMGTGASAFAGSLGVGTTSPTAKLEVAGGGGTSIDLLVNGRLRSNNNDGGLWVASDRLVGGFDTNKIGFWSANAWRFAVLNNGYVGIGTTTPSAMLTVNGDLTFAAAPTTIRADGGRLHITGGEILYLLNKSGVVVGREWGGNGNVTVEGNVGIGTAINDTSNQRLCVSGTTWLRGDTFITGRFVMQINDTTWWGIGPRESLGVQWAAYYGTGGPDTSDVRLKADLRPITHAVRMVRMLQGVRYRWGDSGLKYFTQGIDHNLSAGPNATEDQSDRIRESERRKALEALAGDRLGLVAQDVETVIPELVHEDGDGYKHIRYQHLTALLVEAIKEQDATVRALSAQVAALSTRQPDRAVRRGGSTEHA
jgi:Chaperone of endosialidase